MANKTREEALKTRQLILDTALEVIKRNGYDRASLLYIAEQAGVTRGAVYGNFQNKSKLFGCILQNWKLPDILTTRILTSSDSLGRICSEILEALEGDGLYRTIYSLATTPPSSDEEQSIPLDELDRAYRQLVNLFETFLGEGQKRGDISKKQDISKASTVLLSYLIGLGKVWSVEQSKFSLSEWARGFIDIFLRGLKED